MKKLTNQKFQKISDRTRNNIWLKSMKEEDENRVEKAAELPIKNKKRKVKQNAWTEFLEKENFKTNK
jgi:hypothetical protein